MGIIGGIGRMCLSLIFILAAINKLLHWQGAEQSLVDGICDVMNYSDPQGGIYLFLERLLPWAPVLLPIGFAFELLGGLFLFFGIKVRFGALLLALFLIPITFLFHHFWFLAGPDRELQMTMFLKNLGIFGGLLVLLAYGKKKPAESKVAHKPKS